MEEQQWMARAIGAENAEERLRAALREMSERKEYFRQIWEVAEAECATLRATLAATRAELDRALVFAAEERRKTTITVSE